MGLLAELPSSVLSVLPGMDSSEVFGPPPKGIDLAENQTGQIYGAVVTVLVLATAAVLVRIVARSKLKGIGGFAVDDVLILVALVRLPSASFVCSAYASLDFHMGRRDMLFCQCRTRRWAASVDPAG